jgi:WD40 repeat protein
VWDVAAGRCLAVLEGHTGLVTSVALTPDGRTAVSGSDDQTLRVWDVATGRCLAILEGRTGEVFSLSVTPDGRTAVSMAGHNPLRVCVWDVATGRRLGDPKENEDRLRALASTREENALASCAFEGHFLVLRLKGTGVLARFPGSFSEQACTPDAQYVVAGTGAGQVYFLRLRSRGDGQDVVPHQE